MSQQHKREPRNNFRGSHIRRRKRRRRRIDWKRFIPALVLLAVFLYSAISLIRFAVHSASTKSTNEALQAMYREAAETPDPSLSTPEPAPLPTPTPEPAATSAPQLSDAYQYIGSSVLPEAEKLLNQNPDTVAWLRIPGVVDLPVVYRDNEYYLDHDFHGKKSDSGTLFLDEAHPFAADTQYMVIHGHNMHDGSMFGRVSHYRREGYMEEHPVLYLDTLYRREEYEVIGVLFLPVSVQDRDYVPYTGTRKFESLDHFNGFVSSLRQRALYWNEGAQLLPSDAFLALSTCYEDHRIVILFGRRGLQPTAAAPAEPAATAAALR